MLKKINFKLFIPLSLFIGLVFSLFFESYLQRLGFVVTYFGTLMWMGLIVFMVYYLLKVQSKEGRKPNWFFIFLMFALKFLFFLGVLYIGWQLMGKKLFIALLNLPIQVILLSVTMRMKEMGEIISITHSKDSVIDEKNININI